MKKLILPLSIIFAAVYFLISANFRLFTDDLNKPVNRGQDTVLQSRPHDVVPENENQIFKEEDLMPVIPNPGPYIPSIYTNVNISQNSAPQNEPTVRISHKSPNRVVAAWRDFRLGIDPNAVRRVGYSYSTDGGTTWSVSALLDSTLLGGGLLRNSDPALVVDTAGNFYCAVIALNNSNGNGTLAVYKSTDGGVTFPSASIAAQGGSEDKEYITCDFSPTSPYANSLYISWTRFAGNTGIKLTKSTNGGVNWSAPVNISDATGGGQGSDLCVSSNGQINVVWLAGGSTAQLYYDRSTNGGASFGTDMIIASGPAPVGLPNGVGTFPSIACDFSSGPRSSNVYAVFCDNRNGDADVFFTRSTNGGTTWSAPLRVNNDPLSNGKIQYWPWIAVNESRKIAIVFMDTRNTANNTTIEAWLARSNDGGLTFTNEVLSSQPSPTNIPGSNVRFGDYIGIDFWRNRIVPVWTDERAGGFNMDIFTAVIDITVGIQPTVNQIPDKFELKQNFPNPFNATTSIRYDLPVQSTVNLIIFDINGRLIENVLDGETVDAGEHILSWDASKYSSGVYFYELRAVSTDYKSNYLETKKMLLVK